MNDKSQTTTKPLTASQRDALRDCSVFQTYLWKPKAMAKLAERGLVERIPTEDRAGQLAWRVTPDGRKELNND